MIRLQLYILRNSFKLVKMNSKTTSQACSYDRFCLGMCKWTDCPGAGLGRADAKLPHPLQITYSKVLSPYPFIEQQPSISSSTQPSIQASTFNLWMPANGKKQGFIWGEGALKHHKLHSMLPQVFPYMTALLIWVMLLHHSPSRTVQSPTWKWTYMWTSLLLPSMTACIKSMLYTPQCVNSIMYGCYITNVTTIFIEHAEFRIFSIILINPMTTQYVRMLHVQIKYGRSSRR